MINVDTTTMLPKLSDLVADVLTSGGSDSNPLVERDGSYFMRYDAVGMQLDPPDVNVMLYWHGRVVHMYKTAAAAMFNSQGPLRLDGIAGEIPVYLNRPAQTS